MGASVILGAVEEIYKTKGQIGERLTIVSFPQNVPETERQLVYMKYREQMIGKAGYAVFLAGNKEDPNHPGGPVINAEGTSKEFEIAMRLGAVPIPIGASGSVAKELWQKVQAEPGRYHLGSAEAVRFLDVLGQEGSPEKIVQAVVDLITHLG